MTHQDWQRLKILVVLLAGLGLTLVFGDRINRAPTASAVMAPEADPPASSVPEANARIQLEAIRNRQSEEQIGRNNLFQYRTRPQPPADPFGFQPAPASEPPLVSGPPEPPTAPGPPPPPAIPFTYGGFAEVTSGTGQLKAVLTAEDGRPYTVVQGEVLMGRYRITRVTETAVEVEDLESGRRQSLPLDR